MAEDFGVPAMLQTGSCLPFLISTSTARKVASWVVPATPPAALTDLIFDPNPFCVISFTVVAARLQDSASLKDASPSKLASPTISMVSFDWSVFGSSRSSSLALLSRRKIVAIHVKQETLSLRLVGS